MLKTKKQQDGFVALISVVFFSAILCIMLFLRVERLGALETQFENAVSNIHATADSLSCVATSTLIQITGSAYPTSSCPS